MADGEREYPQSSLAAFEQGCRLDLRVRLAIDLLKSPAITAFSELVNQRLRATGAQDEAVVTAGFALDLAAALLAEADKRGWVKELDERGDLTVPEKRQAERNGRFNAAGQFYAQRAMNELAAGQVQVPGRA